MPSPPALNVTSDAFGFAGACIVRTVMDKLDQETFTVSDRGLRHGLLIDRFGT